MYFPLSIFACHSDDGRLSQWRTYNSSNYGYVMFLLRASWAWNRSSGSWKHDFYGSPIDRMGVVEWWRAWSSHTTRYKNYRCLSSEVSAQLATAFQGWLSFPWLEAIEENGVTTKQSWLRFESLWLLRLVLIANFNANPTLRLPTLQRLPIASRSCCRLGSLSPYRRIVLRRNYIAFDESGGNLFIGIRWRPSKTWQNWSVRGFIAAIHLSSSPNLSPSTQELQEYLSHSSHCW